MRLSKSAMKSNGKFNESRKAGLSRTHQKKMSVGSSGSEWKAALGSASAFGKEHPPLCLFLLPGLLLYSKWSRMMHYNASLRLWCTPPSAHTQKHTQNSTHIHPYPIQHVTFNLLFFIEATTGQNEKHTNLMSLNNE